MEYLVEQRSHEPGGLELLDIPYSQAKTHVKLTIALIGKNLAQHKKVRLEDFGILTPGMRSGRTGRNPRTGEKVWVGKRPKCQFRPSKDLLKAIDNHQPEEEKI
ncbi:hypothetical protein CCP3SC15_6550004 [Gammaproteobacteria bacterium]